MENWFKDFVKRIKETFEFQADYKKLVEQIPDAETIDDYFYDVTTNTWVRKSTMPDRIVVDLQDRGQFKTYHSENDKLVGGIEFWKLIELPNFIASGITVIFYGVTGKFDHFRLYYGTDYPEEYSELQFYTDIEETAIYTLLDIKPSNKFWIYVKNLSEPGADILHYTVLFFSKNFRISDVAYDESTWNAVTGVGASKNAIRDQIEAMITAYTALISDIAYDATTWNAVTTIAPSKNAIRDKIEAMDTLTEAEILALTWEEEDITDLDHDDTEAIHENVASEISAITEKETPVDADMIIIEDSEASNAKKMVQLSNLPAGNGADYSAELGIGIDNKRWINCIFEYGIDPASMGGNTSLRNRGSTNMTLIFGVPLPYIIGTHNLVITKVKVGVADADADDYVTTMYLAGWTAYNNDSYILSDGSDLTSAQEKTYDIADTTIGGVYERIMIYLGCVNTTANQLDISYVQIEYYYTE